MLAISLPGSDFYKGSDMMLSSFTPGNMMGNLPEKFTIRGKILILNSITGEMIKEITLEGIAYNAVFSPGGNELWTAIMQPEGKVMVYDMADFSPVKSIDVGEMPSEVSFSGDGQKVFVANGMSNTVTIIDASTKQIIGTCMAGNYPVGVWPGMDDIMDVESQGDQRICFIESGTNTVEDSVEIGFVPGEVATNTRMRQMWITDPINGEVHIWSNPDTAYIPSGTVSVGDGASAITFSRDGTMCYVANQNEGTVSVVDVARKVEVTKIAVGRKPNGIVLRYS